MARPLTPADLTTPQDIALYHTHLRARPPRASVVAPLGVLLGAALLLVGGWWVWTLMIGPLTAPQEVTFGGQARQFFTFLGFAIVALPGLFGVLIGLPLLRWSVRRWSSRYDERARWGSTATARTSLVQALPDEWRFASSDAATLTLVAPHTRHVLLMHFSPDPPKARRTALCEELGAREHTWWPASEEESVAAGDRPHFQGGAGFVAKQLLYWEEVAAREAARRRRGVDVEREAVRALQTSAPSGWTVRIGLLLSAKRGDIDALLTGPGGERVVVEVKSHRGLPQMRENLLYFGSDEKGEVFDQVRCQAREADALPIVWQPLASYKTRRLSGVTFVSGNSAKAVWDVVTEGA